MTGLIYARARRIPITWPLSGLTPEGSIVMDATLNSVPILILILTVAFPLNVDMLSLGIYVC
jgi:hypothetical protein